MEIEAFKQQLAIALTRAVHMSEIPAEYKDYPVIGRGNTSIILEKDPKTAIMLTRDSMKKDWLHFGLSISKDFKIHDIETRNRAFRDLSIFAIEMPKLYKPDIANLAKIRKEVSFFKKARSHVGIMDSKKNIDKMMSYYEQNEMEESLVYHLLNFLTNYYHDQWDWDIAKRQFAQDADGNIILLDPIVSSEVLKSMFARSSLIHKEIAAKYKITSELQKDQKLLDAVYKASEDIYGKGFFEEYQEYDGEMTQEKWEKMVLKANEKLKKLPSQFPIYRGLSLKASSSLKKDDLGVHWSFDKKCADVYDEPEHIEGAELYFLKVVVSKADIDWHQTLALLTGPHHYEKEVSLKSSVKSRNLDTVLYDSDFKRIEKFHGKITETWSDILEQCAVHASLSHFNVKKPNRDEKFLRTSAPKGETDIKVVAKMTAKKSDKSKIISALYRIIVGDVLPFKQTTKQKNKPNLEKDDSQYEFLISDELLRGKGVLAVWELLKIEREVDRVTKLINECDSEWDMDVINNLQTYLEAIENRLEISLNLKEQPENANKVKKIEKKLRLIKSMYQGIK